MSTAEFMSSSSRPQGRARFSGLWVKSEVVEFFHVDAENGSAVL